MIDTTSVLGYAAPLAVEPGRTVRFHFSSATLTEADLAVVRVRCADPDPAGPGLKTVALPSPIDGRVALRHQPIHPGSCMIVSDTPALAGLRSLTVGCFLWPTAPAGRAQTIIARWRDEPAEGWRLGLDDAGCLEFAVSAGGATGVVRTDRPLVEREWVFVWASYDTADGQMRVGQASLDAGYGRARNTRAEGVGPLAPLRWVGMPFVMAAHGTGRSAPAPETAAHFDGKIDRPRLYARAIGAGRMLALCEQLAPAAGDPDLIGAWDFSIDIPGLVARDRSANRLDGRLVHLPARGMTGANWDGTSDAWSELPAHYGAIHFHSDDMADCGWSPDRELAVPENWPSGFYALRLSATIGDEPVESYVPFFVRPPLGHASAPVAFVASTATFLAYANSALRLDQIHAESMLEGLVTLSRDDCYLQEHRELGLSTYDTHADGSGWMYSGAARPILNMRPRGNTFNYVNDTFVLDWLETEGIAYDVITDEEIHRHGAQALRPYRAVITGTHPEYFSREMWDGFDAYQRGGGRHMYLGGNGFYWRIAFHRDLPSTVEVRRGIAGTRTWESEAGEIRVSATGEPAALWRSNGRPPQRLVGVGFDAQVFDRSASYRRLEASFDPAVAFVFDGVGADETIGDFGLRNGGAAGLEIDRADATLGSPPGLRLLATADRIGYGGMPTTEEFRTTHRGLDGEQNARVRADMVLFATGNGGAVFATGSIAWATALPHQGYRNNVARITGNVLRRFLDPAPIALD